LPVLDTPKPEKKDLAGSETTEPQTEIEDGLLRVVTEISIADYQGDPQEVLLSIDAFIEAGVDQVVHDGDIAVETKLA